MLVVRFLLSLIWIFITFGSNDSCTNDIKHIDWNKLLNSPNSTISEKEMPYYNLTTFLDTNTLEITIIIQLEYIGTSTNDERFNSQYDLGTTYWIDFESFGIGNKINEPGNCQNRVKSSYDNITNFVNYWGFSSKPYIKGNIGSNSYLSYPPTSSYWSLSTNNNDSCSPIIYKGVFSWQDLTECTNFNGDKLNDIYSNDQEIKLSTTLYVNIVSPYMMNEIDTEIYRTFPLIQQNIEIILYKQINILSSNGVELFIISVIGIFEDETDGSFEMSVLTQSVDYIKLRNPQILSSPNSNLNSVSINAMNIFGDNCLIASSYTCAQLFGISINNANKTKCPWNVAGIYDILFHVSCISNHTQCQSFIDDNNGSTQIVLSLESSFIDNNCQSEIYQITFNGIMRFYDDEEFTKIHNKNGDGYRIGIDTIYIEIQVGFPNDGSGDNFDIFNVVIDNVFACTANDSVDLSINNHPSNGPNGCLSSKIDKDGYYNIILNGKNINYEAQIIENEEESNIIRFSFLTFNIGRKKMYIHAQLTLEMMLHDDDNTDTITRRRRVLLQTDTNTNTNQIRHFLGDITVTEMNYNSDIDSVDVLPLNPIANDNKSDYTYSIQTILFVGISVIVSFLCIILIIIIICKRINISLEKQVTNLNKENKKVDIPVRIQLGSFSQTETHITGTETPRSKGTRLYDQRQVKSIQKSQQYDLSESKFNALMNMINGIEILEHNPKNDGNINDEKIDNEYEIESERKEPDKDEDNEEIPTLGCDISTRL